MYLKKIELIGFKSFPDRTEIKFDRGINAIVGPNGCGKSNISDAARWALGEQSVRSLRGVKIEDLIFNGTGKRHPLNYAEVTLLFDNSVPSVALEYQEVAVTRRFYRSGESDFLINNQPCRLKDIADLFIDTGLGKEGYSIVGQGQIEQVLSSRPEEIREMLEEAAGISKYRLRKEEAMRRLHETGQNLQRVGDLLAELERELEPLQAEAKKAEEYLAFQGRRRSLEKALLLKEAQDKHDETAKLEASYSRLEEMIETGNKEVAAKEEHCSALKLQAAEARETLEGCKQKLYEVNSALEQAQTREEMASHQLQSRQEQAERLEKEISRLQSGLKEINQRRQTLQAQQTELLQQKQDLESRRLAIQQEIEGIKSGEEYTRLGQNRETYYARREEVRLLEQQIEDAEGRQRSLDGEIEGIHADLSAGAEKEQQYQANMQQLAGQIRQLQDQLNINRETKAKVALEKEQLEQKLLSREDELRQKLQLYREKEQRLNWLKEQEQQLEGYYGGVKGVLSSAGEIGGIIGVVGSLINVPRRLETAVETALGGALQYIITEDDRAARRAVDDLKRRQWGRATFLPLAQLRPRDNAWQGSMQGVIGQASQLVQVEPHLQKVADFLLGNCLIVEDMDAALAIAREAGSRWRLVTLDGDLVNPGGTITGGSRHKNHKPLLGRKREIAELAHELEQVRREGEALRSQTEDLHRQVETLTARLKAAESEKDKLELEQQDMHNRLDAVTRQKELSDQAREQKENQLSKLQQEKEDNRRRIRDLQGRLQELSDGQARLEAQLRELADQAALKQQEEARRQETLTDIMVQEGAVNEQLRSLQQQLQEWQGSLSSQEDQLTSLREELQAVSSGIEECRKRCDSAKNHRREMEMNRQEQVRKVQEAQNLMTKAQEDFNRAEEAAEKDRRQLRRLEKRFHQVEMDLTRCGMEESRLQDRLESYRDITSALLGETITEEQAREECECLRLQEQELEPVNTGAIEEYRRLGERVTYLSSEREDLLAGDESLHKVIRQMEREMETRFREAFVQINDNYRRVFKTLFNGGSGELRLTDNDDPLTGGVQVMAQPPGKKLQSLTLLSGGEKTMAAIALLFALLHYKPSPICFLDEIESSLDESNLGRFLVYLQRLSSGIQFILITHRRRTMEMADNLYGVTMSEPGVSQVLSVHLEDELPQLAAQ